MHTPIQIRIKDKKAFSMKYRLNTMKASRPYFFSLYILKQKSSDQKLQDSWADKMRAIGKPVVMLEPLDPKVGVQWTPLRPVTELQIRHIKLTSIDTTCVNSSSNPMFDHLLELSRRDNSNKWSHIRFSEE